MTVDELHDLFTEAAQTERWLPRAIKRAATTWWPDVQAEWLSYADADTKVRLTPSAEQIDRYEMAIELSLIIDDDDRRLVWAVAHSSVGRGRGPRWAKIGRLLGIERRTLKARYLSALARLSWRLMSVSQ
jgi:hypothetical protein